MSLVKSINGFNHYEYKYYFIDTNIWIAYLRYTILDDKEDKVIPYINFIDEIIRHNEHLAGLPKKLADKSHHIKIIFSNTLLSEILNTSLREICMKEYFRKLDKNYKQFIFKNDYRSNVKSDYKEQLAILVDDIKSYSNHILQLDDFFSHSVYPVYLDRIDCNIDYNDMYFEHIITNSNLEICLVTDDGDFTPSTFPILTLNRNLLKIKK